MCNKCQTNNCGCNTVEVIKICNTCKPVESCDCAVKDLSTDCILYKGARLDCSGIEKNTQLTDVIQQMDEYICEAISNLNVSANLVNVGDGAKVYKGVDGIGRKQIRSIKGSGGVTVTETADTIVIGATLPSIVTTEVVSVDNIVNVSKVSTLNTNTFEVSVNTDNLPKPDGSETKINAGTNVTVTGNGTTTTPYTISSATPTGAETKVTAGTNVTVSGTGTTASPYVISSSGGGSPGADLQGFQDTILHDNLVDQDLVVDLEFGSSYIMQSTPLTSVLSPYFKMDTESMVSSFGKTVIMLGIVDDTFDQSYGSNMIAGFVIEGNDDNYYTGVALHDKYGQSIWLANFQGYDPLGRLSLVPKVYVDEALIDQKVITSSVTLDASYNGKTVYVENDSNDITITVDSTSRVFSYLYSNPSAYTFNVGFVQKGTGTVTFVASGVTLNSEGGKLKIRGQHDQVYLEMQYVGTGAGTYTLFGNRKA